MKSVAGRFDNKSVQYEQLTQDFEKGIKKQFNLKYD